RLTEQEIRARVQNIHCTDMDAFFRSVGSNNKLLDKRGLKKLFPEINPKDIEPEKKPVKRVSQMYRLVSVEGYQDVDVSFARCCNPIKGDKIAGFITKNRGLVIHKDNCANLRHVMPTRRLQVNWNEDVEDHSYQVRYDLVVMDKPGLLSVISTVIAGFNSNIRRIENENISQHMNKLKITFEVKDTSQLSKIEEELKTIKDIYQIIRKKV
ncbi:MAG TPA: ACT domain-containing protein, partial [Candidatus Deferrimicrobium sp.]|nr:ACT domain-containing protein [Candidatus Deferrimicrobium sp.]